MDLNTKPGESSASDENPGVPSTCAAAVANAFLDLQANDHSEFPRIDPMKLQKLTYYAHAWWLAHTGQPLFDDDIEAWPWGPVIRNLYNEFSEFGSRPIAGKKATELIASGNLNFVFKVPEEPDEKVKSFLKSVWETHKGLTGVQLSNATHAPGEPWSIIKNSYPNLDGNPRIPNSLIKDVFKNKLEEAEKVA